METLEQRQIDWIYETITEKWPKDSESIGFGNHVGKDNILFTRKDLESLETEEQIRQMIEERIKSL